jgi:dolichol-phosphate mannosyltransferase
LNINFIESFHLTDCGVQKDKAVRLSVVIPCYNESTTLLQCVERLLRITSAQLSLEVIIVDDCSNDGSYDIAQALAREFDEVRTIRHSTNQGKGAALRTGFQLAGGDIVAVQDADLEYEPKDLIRLIQPILEDRADAVLGSRFQTAGPHRVLYFWHYLGNRLLTFFSNMLTDLNLTDMETCYKVVRKQTMDKIVLEESGFGFDPEMVAKLAHQNARIYEMGISYHGRTYAEGKKIGIKDGLWSFYCIFKYNMPHLPLPMRIILAILLSALLLFIIAL